MSFILLLYCFYLEHHENRLIESWTRAILVWVGMAYFSLELLSIFSLVTLWTLIAFWGLLDLALLVWILIRRKKGSTKSIKLEKEFLIRIAGILYKNLIWILLAVGLIHLAVRTVPYNWDSMAYHLPRVANWAQNQSVGHYATYDLRGNVSPVLAEFINLHVYILSGNKDYFVNLLQCLSALANVWLVYEIAIKIGCSRRYSQLAAFLFFTCPIAFAEALTTQVDQFATLWLLIFVYYYLDMIEEEYHVQYDKKTISICLILGGCIAFGYLTKPSVLIGMAVLAVLLLVKCIRKRESVKTIIGLLLWVVPEMLLFLFPEMFRNVQSFGSITLPMTGQRQLVGTVNPLYILVNGLKNYAFNLPTVYMEKSGPWIEAFIYRIADILKVAINDPSISEDGGEFILHEFRTYGHDTAVNDIVIWWFTLCLLWGIWRFRKQKNKIGKFYAMSVSVIFILFCCLVRWEPYVVRYMISYLALLCPVIAYEIEDFREYLGSRVIATWPAAVIIFMCGVELIGLVNFHRPISQLGDAERFYGYFYEQRYLYDDYKKVCSLIPEEANEVGLLIGAIDYEFPLWQQLEEKEVCIRHIMVENISSRYEDAAFVPDYIISSRTSAETLEYHGQMYYLQKECKDNSHLWLYCAG
ncbi:MAG: glycosyltransferase family 39 protein [Clostridium sp.]|nr:glycosyltransferase family 39 protein [Lachnoclostridium sp.]MCM1252991.1 glycosyltransferase family 39 protein [Clostridium sp.]